MAVEHLVKAGPFLLNGAPSNPTRHVRTGSRAEVTAVERNNLVSAETTSADIAAAHLSSKLVPRKLGRQCIMGRRLADSSAAIRDGFRVIEPDMPSSRPCRLHVASAGPRATRVSSGALVVVRRLGQDVQVSDEQENLGEYVPRLLVS